LYGWMDWSSEPVVFGSFRKLDGWGVIGAIEDSMVVVSELHACPCLVHLGRGRAWHRSV